MVSQRSIIVDVFPQSAFRHLDRDAIVCIDVIRATTTLITSVAQGRVTHPAVSVSEAMTVARTLKDPLLAGEVNGIRPGGFEIQNSPAAVAARADVWRPLVLVSTSGTQLIANAKPCSAVYIASFQNITATADHLASRHRRVAIIGAGSLGEFRCEDQMAAAWLAGMLVDWGFRPEDELTSALVKRWRNVGSDRAAEGDSAAYLRRTGQHADLEFVLNHVDDLELVCVFESGQIRSVPEPKPCFRAGDAVNL